ncbi:MAG: nucleotide-binding protein [Rhodospirillales bacterium]|nr:nucleotide-binding protein [Rhodospirillales bacterium]
MSDAAPQQNSGREIVLVTGLSGSGLSTALAVLEDLGYETIDNLPLFLIDPLLAHEDWQGHPVAIGVDSRTRDFSASSLRSLCARLGLETRCRLLFVDASDEVLLRRFTETRRRHPLADDRPVADGIARDRALLEPLRSAADVVIDTSDLTIHETKRIIAGHFTLATTAGLRVSVVSFSYGRGLPREADLVFDVRFLRNPHYEPELQPLDGRDARVADYVRGDGGFAPFVDHLKSLLGPLLPAYRHEGKAYLTIAFGCTGGRHRSVFLAELIGAWIGDLGLDVTVAHRDAARWRAVPREGGDPLRACA